MHLARLEFIGYHVFHEDYQMLTPFQALFIDYGVMKVYSQILGGDEKEQRKMRHRSRRR